MLKNKSNPRPPFSLWAPGQAASGNGKRKSQVRDLTLLPISRVTLGGFFDLGACRRGITIVPAQRGFVRIECKNMKGSLLASNTAFSFFPGLQN